MTTKEPSHFRAGSVSDDGFDRQIQKDFKKLAKHISKHPFVQNKEQFEGYTVFELEGVKFITLLDAKIIIGKALLQGRAEFRKEMDKFRKWLIENLTEEDHYVAKNPPQIVKLLRADVVLKKFDELLKGGKG